MWKGNWGEGWRGRHLHLGLALEGFWGSGKPLGENTKVLQGGAQLGDVPPKTEKELL